MSCMMLAYDIMRKLHAPACIYITHNILTHMHMYTYIRDRFGIYLSEENTERTDESLMLTAQALGATKNLDIGFVRAIKNHDPAATAAAKAARKATAKANGRKTLVAIALNNLHTSDTDGLSEDVLVKRGFAFQLAGGRKCKGMRYADILVIAHKVRSWAGKYDAYNAEINKRVRERGITEEEAAVEMEELKGKDRHAYNRSLDGKSHGGRLGSQVQGRRLATAEGLQSDTLTDEKKKVHVSRAMQAIGHTANAASIVSRAGAARSLHDRMYDRVLQLNAQQTKYAADAEAWFEGVQSDLAGVVSKHIRSQALAKLGILMLQDYKDINSLFKKSGGWEKAPDTKNLLVRSRHQGKIANAKMAYIQKTHLKSQMKRTVSDDNGEMERLLTVLYYDLYVKSYTDATADERE